MSLGSRILDLIYPPKCVLCGKLLKNEEKNICCECNADFEILCPEKSGQSFTNIRLSIAPFYYEGKIRDALLRYKFHGKSCYSKFFAVYMYEELNQTELKPDIITWVPLSRKRLRARGYDQARLLAEELSELTSTECVRLLKKRRNVKPQSTVGAYEERKKNISGAYSAYNVEKLQSKNILLIDDIITTGSTAGECAGELLKAGAGEIFVLTVARTKY